MRTLTTTDLTLEPLRAAHAEAMFEVLRDPALYAFEHAPPASVDALRERYVRQEVGRSPDGSELWLNWVVRLAGGPLIGYVQATVMQDASYVAYVFGSPWWGRGYATRATRAMLDELALTYGVRHALAVAVRRNVKSLHLLERLGFTVASDEHHARRQIDPAEVLWERAL